MCKGYNYNNILERNSDNVASELVKAKDEREYRVER